MPGLLAGLISRNLGGAAQHSVYGGVACWGPGQAALMYISLWKQITNCASLIIANDGGRRDTQPAAKGAVRRMQESKLREALEEASEVGSFSKSQDGVVSDGDQGSGGIVRSRSLARLRAQNDFLRATALAAERTFSAPSSIPSLHESMAKFLSMYPSYKTSDRIDALRSQEYSHLADPGAKVCLDYCGFGLFSSLQDWESSAFTLSGITPNLGPRHGPEKGTAEHDVKARILDYLNIPDGEYGLVFTVSRGSAFKLLAQSYPFRPNKRLLTMFDHESESVNWMEHSAREKGAKVHSAWFKWPTLKLCSTELRKLITAKKWWKRDSAVGLFVFPVQSRVTGAKYSYQWMALAQKNNWHVLLDAGSLGPKDMDSLGLSLFRPDFIITSFYRVFGADPTGFGCLLIKKSAMSCLQSENGDTGSGIVRIVPVLPQYLTDSGDDVLDGIEDDMINVNEGQSMPNKNQGSQLPAFSGAYTSAQVRDAFENEMDQGNSSDRDGPSTIFEETESVSIGEVMKSPVFSEDESLDSSFWIGLGESPFGSDRSGKLASPLRPSWFAGKKNHKKIPSKLSSKVPPSPLYDDHSVSFDAAVFSVSQEIEVHKEDPVENRRKHADLQHASEIEEELEITQAAGSRDLKFSTTNGTKDGVLTSEEGHHIHKDGYISEISSMDLKESNIRRETEGEFRLLGRREGNDNTYSGASTMDNHYMQAERPRTIYAAETSAGGPVDDTISGLNDEHIREQGRREPEIVCRHLDHINSLGLNKTTIRLRYLINWLVASLLQLRLPEKDGDSEVPLVHIYGPKIKYERGAAVAFNVKDHSGGFIRAEVVLKMAEKDGISLGVGFLNHLRVIEKQKPPHEKHSTTRVEVLTASLGFLTNFEDAYKMWAFVAKFLDPSFLEGDRLSTIAESLEE